MRILVKHKELEKFFEVEYDGPGWYIEGHRQEIYWPDLIPDNAHYIDIDQPTHEYKLPVWWRRLIRWWLSS